MDKTEVQSLRATGTNALLLLLLLPLTSLAAEETPAIERRARVRVSARSYAAERVLGNLIAVDADTLVMLKARTVPVALPVASVTRLEVLRRGGRTVRKILVGGVVGGINGLAFGAVGAVIGAGLENCGTDDEDEFCPVGGIVVGGAIGGIIGYPLGSALGVYAVGNKTGSFPATLGGSFLGLLLGLGATIVSDGSLWPLLFVGPPIGATIGFNMTAAERWEKVSLPLRVGLSPTGGARVALRFEFGR